MSLIPLCSPISPLNSKSIEFFSPIVIDTFLENQEFNALSEELNYVTWRLCNWSDSNNPFLFFGVPKSQYPHHLHSYASSASLKTKKYIKSKLEFIRLHINGQVFGQEGQFHCDSKEPEFISVLLFTNAHWEFSWGGGFTYVTKDLKNTETIGYKPNRAVIFPSNLLHCGQAPSRFTDALRTSVVFLFKRHD